MKIDLNVGKWFYAVLAGNPAVVQLVQSRIYPVNPSLATGFPCITYRRLSSDIPTCQFGLAGPIRPTVRVSAWDRNYDNAVAVSSAVLAALTGGQLPVTPLAGIRVSQLIPKDAGDEFYQPMDGSKDSYQAPYLDFLVNYQVV